jgi:hypothetical protein
MRRRYASEGDSASEAKRRAMHPGALNATHRNLLASHNKMIRSVDNKDSTPTATPATTAPRHPAEPPPPS